MNFLSIVCTVLLNAQNSTPPNYFKGAPGDDVFATPSVQAFHESNLIPENLYTGKIGVNIPIYNVTIDGIDVPISLSYNTSGIKVSDIASNVGLGWSLNANGSILKVVRDLSDDEFYGSGYSEYDDTGDNAGTFDWIVTQIGSHRGKSPEPYSYYSATTGWMHGNSSNAVWKKVDSSPDFFYVNAPGLNTKFFLEDANPNDDTTVFANRTFNAIFLDHSGIKINNTLQRNTTTVPRLRDPYPSNPTGDYTVNGIPFFNYDHLDFSTFEVVNTNGVKYIFDVKDYSESTYRGYRNSTNTGFNSTNWNLSKIIDPTTNREVEFIYESYFKATPELTKNITSTYQDPSDSGESSDLYYVEFRDVTVNWGTYTMDFQSTVNTVSPKVNRLKTILWDKGTVEFVYGLNRLDDLDEKALTEIIVKNNLGQTIKHFQLSYSYFNSKENCNDKECKRLKLDAIEELPIGNSTTNAKKHSFDYNYDNPLPRRDSFQRDYLGYYNNNGFEWTATDDTQRPPNPILHFYKNQGSNAILPFKRTNGANYRIIHGQYSLEPNAYSLTATLKTIIYPTGGSSHFKYENHTFNLQGAQYIAGGARIKQQTLHDGRGGTRNIFYEYKNTNGSSSGYMNRMPTFGHLNKQSDAPSNFWVDNFSMTAPENDWKKYFTCYDKTKNSLELTDGSFIGYARILKKENGNGHTEYNYTNPNQYPNQAESVTSTYSYNPFFLNNSSFPSLNIIDYEVKRGNLINEKQYSENGSIKKQSDYEYTYEVFDTIDLLYLTEISGNPFTQGANGKEFEHTSQINIERNLNTKVTTTDYLDNGIFTSTQEIRYDTNYPFIKEQKILTEQGTEKTLFTFPYESVVSNEPYMSDLVAQNRIATPVEHKSIRVKDNQSQLLSRTKYSFDVFEGIINHKSNLAAKGSNDFITLATIDKRDTNGNVLEYHNENGTHVCFVWGYNSTKPVAKIENASYVDFNPTQNDMIAAVIYLSNNDIDATSEDNLRQALENLRQALPNSTVTTYTYNPLKGITSMTDPRGYTMYYEYDEFNRLKSVKDADKNLLSTNEYNYKD